MRYILYLIFLQSVTSFKITPEGVIESETIECSVVGKAYDYDVDSLLNTGDYDTITARNPRQALKKYLER